MFHGPHEHSDLPRDAYKVHSFCFFQVPDDNEDNLGGLNKSDIWLADNHLLVLRGGVYPETDSRPPEYGRPPAWPPIDDYSAPRRQVKIPEHPRVPPPFPVQLWDGGPFQILGTNSSRTLNDSVVKEYLLSTVEGFDPNNLPPFAKGKLKTLTSYAPTTHIPHKK